jgi:hypothetical protein
MPVDLSPLTVKGLSPHEIEYRVGDSITAVIVGAGVPRVMFRSMSDGSYVHALSSPTSESPSILRVPVEKVPVGPKVTVIDSLSELTSHVAADPPIAVYDSSSNKSSQELINEDSILLLRVTIILV